MRDHGIEFVPYSLLTLHSSLSLDPVHGTHDVFVLAVDLHADLLAALLQGRFESEKVEVGAADPRSSSWRSCRGRWSG